MGDRGRVADAARPAHFVPAYLREHGYRVVPVNPLPAGQTILGEICYASLEDVPVHLGVEVVDLFRRSEQWRRTWTRP